MNPQPTPWRDTPYTDAPEPWRHLGCTLLLGAYFGAAAGDPFDVLWMQSREAASLADLVGLPTWPPPAGEFFTPEQLIARAEMLCHTGRITLRGSPVRHHQSAWEKSKARKEKDRARRTLQAKYSALFAEQDRVSSTVPPLWAYAFSPVTTVAYAGAD